MRTKMFLFILLLAVLFSFASCGDETSADNGQQQIKVNSSQPAMIQ